MNAIGLARRTRTGKMALSALLAALSIGQVSRISIPYQMHHGSADDVVPPSYDERLVALLAERGVPHELYIYPGGHLVPRLSPLMLERVRAWYEKYGMF